jgi:prepilin-type N-terminal cleavage/methylation domain-containing protein
MVSMNTRPSQRGYTFVEMMVVVAIIVIMMAIVIPRLAFQQRGAGLKGAATELMTALRNARRMAITKREVRALALDIYSIPAEFGVMRPKTPRDLPASPAWIQEGVFQQLPENIAIVAVTTPGWNTVNIARTDDVNPINGIEEGLGAFPTPIYNPGAGNGLVNSIYHLVTFNPTATASPAVIYLWNVTEERRELPSVSAAHALSNLDTLGVPPGLVINNANDQQTFFSLPTAASPDDSYYYTLVVNPITGGVTIYDYAWDDGSGGGWNRRKDGE